MKLSIQFGTKNAAKWEIEPAALLHLAASVLAATQGPLAAPTALNSAANAIKGFTKKAPTSRKLEASALALYVHSLTKTTVELIQEQSQNFNITDETRDEIGSVVVSALCAGPIAISKVHIERPSLNPSFVRYKERLTALLKRIGAPLIEIEQAEAIGRQLGKRFSTTVSELLTNADFAAEFRDLKENLTAPENEGARARADMWFAYKSHLNELVYRNLFLHEMPGHPDASLMDLYTPSRGIYVARKGDLENDGALVDDEEERTVFGFDLHDQLLKSWIELDVKKAGSTRLVTGDPGTGKSTFSLMFAHRLSADGHRVLYIPANSIRSFGQSLSEIVSRHLSLTLSLDRTPNLDAEISDPDATGGPLLIIIDGLDEYDVGDTTVALSAARLVEHAQKAIDDWQLHGRDVRLLLCGRPEAAASLTAHFRGPFQHLQVTGFVHSLRVGEKFANRESEKILEIDQRMQWWRRWQRCSDVEQVGLPEVISNSPDEGISEITSQPLLNYMIAVLKLHEGERISSLSYLYSDLFSQYYNRQSETKFAAFKDICPTLDRFRRIMSEIGIAAWHAGDRSVGTEDLELRFNRPPLKKWLESAGEANRGLSAILSAFYTRPEDSTQPEKGLAHRYVFTHKSFREYLTAVAVVRITEELARRLHPDAEDGWSDKEGLIGWLEVFGPTPIDQRQWLFIKDEFSQTVSIEARLVILRAVVHCLDLSVRRQMPLPVVISYTQALRMVGNAEESFFLIIDAIVCSLGGVGNIPNFLRPSVTWPSESEKAESFELFEIMHRIRSRPGCPDDMLMAHIGGVLQLSDSSIAPQMETKFGRRPDSYEYAVVMDLSGAELKGVSLHEANVPYARFHRAQFTECDFGGCDLDGVDFGHGDLDNCVFEGANISNAILEGVSLQPSGPSREGLRVRGSTSSDSDMAQWFDEQGANVRGHSPRHSRVRRKSKT